MTSLQESSLRYRGKIIIRAIAPFMSKEKRVLDVGCGNGVVSHQIEKHFGCRLLGTDILHYTIKDIAFMRMQKDFTLSFKDNEFDIGLFNDVLHHMPFERQLILIKEALRVCSEVLIFEAKPTLITKLLDRLANHIHNPDMPITLTHRAKEDWLRLFKEQGITAESYGVVKPIIGYPFTNFLFRLSSSKN